MLSRVDINFLPLQRPILERVGCGAMFLRGVVASSGLTVQRNVRAFASAREFATIVKYATLYSHWCNFLCSFVSFLSLTSANLFGSSGPTKCLLMFCLRQCHFSDQIRTHANESRPYQVCFISFIFLLPFFCSTMHSRADKSWRPTHNVKGHKHKSTAPPLSATMKQFIRLVHPDKFASSRIFFCFDPLLLLGFCA
jgi:hypothetical protein